MSIESSSWYRFFSPNLEDWIFSGDPGDPKHPPSKSLEEKLTVEEIEAWNMWVYRSHNILPNQYHHFYENGDTIIYPEHLRDLFIISTMWANKMKKKADAAESKEQAKNHPMLGSNSSNKNNKGKGSSGFYGRTYRYS